MAKANESPRNIYNYYLFDLIKIMYVNGINRYTLNTPELNKLFISKFVFINLVLNRWQTAMLYSILGLIYEL